VKKREGRGKGGKERGRTSHCFFDKSNLLTTNYMFCFFTVELY